MTRCPPANPRPLSRRGILLTGTGLTVGLTLGTMPLAGAGQAATASTAGFEDFMRLSARLTSRDELLPAQGRVAFDALSTRFPGFRDGMARLIGFMEAHDVEVSKAQAALDEAGAEFAWIPRQIVSAWYLGVVGAVETLADAEAGLMPPGATEGTSQAIQTVAWEQALMFVPLAGTIPVPSYAFDGNWAEKPKSGE
ncbi:MAG: sugar dehydrogenase complex small subunit [Geminicoccaceae bacterium]